MSFMSILSVPYFFLPGQWLCVCNGATIVWKRPWLLLKVLEVAIKLDCFVPFCPSFWIFPLLPSLDGVDHINRRRVLDCCNVTFSLQQESLCGLYFVCLCIVALLRHLSSLNIPVVMSSGWKSWLSCRSSKNNTDSFRIIAAGDGERHVLSCKWFFSMRVVDVFMAAVGPWCSLLKNRVWCAYESSVPPRCWQMEDAFWFCEGLVSTLQYFFACHIYYSCMTASHSRNVSVPLQACRIVFCYSRTFCKIQLASPPHNVCRRSVSREGG